MGGPVEAPNRQHEGLSETDVLLQRLYALNIIEQAGYQPALELWQVGQTPSCRVVGFPSEGMLPCTVP